MAFEKKEVKKEEVKKVEEVVKVVVNKEKKAGDEAFEQSAHTRIIKEK